MLPELGKGMVIVCGCLSILTGLIHVLHNVLQPWCTSSSTTSCFGPALVWNKSGETAFLKDSNHAGWRSVLTTDINVVIDIWQPLVFGVIILSSSSIHLRANYYVVRNIAYSWSKMATFLVLSAFFGSFVSSAPTSDCSFCFSRCLPLLFSRCSPSLSPAPPAPRKGYAGNFGIMTGIVSTLTSIYLLGLG